MPRTIEGQLVATNKKFGIIASRFNEFITSKLLEGALDAFTRHGVKDDDMTIAWVPGSYEIPYAVKRMAESGNYDAIVCLGALIRGATPHFDYISAEVTKGIAQVGLATGVPVIYGVITTNTIEEAIERAGTKVGNKGFDAAVSALEMTSLFDQL